MAPSRSRSTQAQPSKPRVRLIQDGAGLWPSLEGIVSRHASLLETALPDAVGVLLWQAATRSELAGLTKIRREHPGPLLVLLAELPSARGARAVMARVEGSMMFDEAELSLGPALAALSTGQCTVSRRIRDRASKPALTARERQVLAMVVLDLSNAEIANKLFLTESSVKSHLTSAFNKLGVASRAEAVELILDEDSGLGLGILRITGSSGQPKT